MAFVRALSSAKVKFMSRGQNILHDESYMTNRIIYFKKSDDF